MPQLFANLNGVEIAFKSIFNSMSFTIKVTKNGPYVVTGTADIFKLTIEADAEGNSTKMNRESESTVTDFALCRCGHSKNAPFCDGSHVKVNFDGTETAQTEAYLTGAQEIDGANAILTDREDLCAFARFCDTYGSIWRIVSESTSPEGLKMAKQQAKNCPSGRLILWDAHSKKSLEEREPEGIGHIEDTWQACSGPLRVTSGIEIESEASGQKYGARNKVTLCRCGKSANKPFCDGMHAAVQYQAQYKNKQT